MKSLLFFTFFIISTLCIIDDSFLSVPTPSEVKLGDAYNLDILKLVGDYCQGSGRDIYQCGPGNCETWSTGKSNGGSNPGRIYCNDNGVFCDGGSCY